MRDFRSVKFLLDPRATRRGEKNMLVPKSRKLIARFPAHLQSKVIDWQNISFNVSFAILKIDFIGMVSICMGTPIGSQNHCISISPLFLGVRVQTV